MHTREEFLDLMMVVPRRDALRRRSSFGRITNGAANDLER
jgi:hypothetical protein